MRFHEMPRLTYVISITLVNKLPCTFAVRRNLFSVFVCLTNSHDKLYLQTENTVTIVGSSSLICRLTP